MGKKSRTKRLVREKQLPPRQHVHSRRQQTGFTRNNLWTLIGIVAILVIGLGFLAKAALTSSPVGPVSSASGSSGSQGAAIGRKVAMAGMALPASSGGHVALSRYRGRKLVVYFHEGVT